MIRDLSRPRGMTKKHDPAARDLKMFVVVRPVGEGLSNTYADSCLRHSPQARDTAIDIARDIAVFDDDTLVEWRSVCATDASAARVKPWPQGVDHRVGTFRLSDFPIAGSPDALEAASWNK